MDITFSTSSPASVDAIVVGVYQGKDLTPAAKDLDSQTQGAILRAIESSDFQGKASDALTIVAPQGLQAQRLLVLGLGEKDKIEEKTLDALGGRVISALRPTPSKSVELRFADFECKGLSKGAVLAHIAYGCQLKSWRFDKYRSQLKSHEKLRIEKITLTSSDADAAQKVYEAWKHVGEGVLFTRELGCEPANVIYPESFVERAKALTSLGVKMEVLGEEEMRKLGMNALLGVGQGSIRESKLLVLQWQGVDSKEAPIAVVGKGVTFDTGGISIKPAGGMEDMKYDMSGAGVVVGLMRALAGRKAKVNVVGVAGLVENMPSGSAQRPGDIVKSMSGQTIEVLNTDAEGRLVLADALWYTQDRFKPKLMVNLATLTGAIVISLGSEFAGLFSNNDELSERLTAAGTHVDEKLWRFPLTEGYDKDINSPVADMKNLGNGREAGSITAAQFLQRFVNKVPWAHLDIAGVAWTTKDLPLAEKGATAFGVRLLNHFVSAYYEKK